jgi:hypothetical protein
MNQDDFHSFPSGSEDITVMLDCLHELFLEQGNKVTPTVLVRRMEQKLHRHLQLRGVAYLYTSLGFITNKIEGDSNHYFIIPNLELLAEKRSQFCEAKNDNNHR